MKRALAALLLFGMATSLGGCVVAGPGYGGPGWCYYHPYRCR